MADGPRRRDEAEAALSAIFGGDDFLEISGSEWTFFRSSSQIQRTRLVSGLSPRGAGRRWAVEAGVGRRFLEGFPEGPQDNGGRLRLRVFCTKNCPFSLFRSFRPCGEEYRLRSCEDRENWFDLRRWSDKLGQELVVFDSYHNNARRTRDFSPYTVFISHTVVILEQVRFGGGASV